MTFIAAKIFWLLAKPSHLIVLLLVAGVAALWLDRPRTGGALVALGTAALVALTLLPIGAWLTVPLENRFPQPGSLPDDVAGVIVLGGAPRLGITAARSQPTFGDEAERVTAIIELGRRYPEARLVFTGGSGLIFGTPLTEADVVRDFLRRQRFDVARVLFEAESRDTYENAVRSKDLVGPEPGERWLLVTSAFHMARSVGVFRRVGWDVIAFPVDYRTTGRIELEPEPVFGLGSRLADLDFAAREWTGLVAYRLMGRTGALFPKP